MHYYIDGYNLLFRLIRHEADFSSLRQQIIKELNALVTLLDLEVTVIFDAQYQVGDTSKSHFQQLTILFSAYGETADDLIIAEIKKERRPKQVTVVTSDKKLAWFARRCEAKTETIGSFLTLLEKRKKNKERRDRELILQKKQIVQPKTPEASAEPIEGGFDYYLQQFEERLKTTHEPKPKAPHVERGKRRKQEREVTSEDAFERWLKIFEDRLKD